jgi:hypothetical protein
MASAPVFWPVEVKIERIRGRSFPDLATSKAVTVGIQEQLEALFRARRRVFRVVNGNPAANGLVIEGSVNRFDVGERTVNGQEVSFRMGLGALQGRRQIAERHFGWPDCPVDPSQRFSDWAYGVVQACVREEAPALLDDCEAWLQRSQR